MNILRENKHDRQTEAPAHLPAARLIALVSCKVDTEISVQGPKTEITLGKHRVTMFVFLQVLPA